MAKIQEQERTDKEKCSSRNKTPNNINNKAHRAAVPPNGGYGWVIVFASFMCAVVIYGILYSFGIFLAYFVDYYDTPNAEVAWIGSLFSGCLFLVGPLSGALINKFGSRVVVAIGSIISTLAFLLSTIVPNIKLLTFTYGILGGVGFGLINVAMLVSVSYYFSSKRAFATGILMCGGSLGNFAVPQLINFLLKIYDWKGTMIILSGLALNCMVFGFLMRPLSLDCRDKKSEVNHSFQNEEHISETKIDGRHKPVPGTATEQSLMRNMHFRTSRMMSHKEASAEVFVLPGSRFCCPNKPNVCAADTMDVTQASSQQLSSTERLSQFLSKKTIQGKEPSLQNLKACTFNNATHRCQGRLSIQQIQRRFSLPSARTLSAQASSDQCASAGNPVSVTPSAAVDSRVLEEPIHSTAILYSGNNITNDLQIQNSQLQPVAKVHLVTGIPHQVPAKIQSKNGTKSTKRFSFFRSMVDFLTRTLDLPLLKELHFFLICIAYVIGMIGFYIPFVFLPHMSITKGIDRDKSSFLISILAIANLAGCCGIGYITDKSKVKVLNLASLCICISGLACLAFPFSFSFATLASVSIIYGFFIATKISLISIILVDILGLEKLANAFGLISLFRGVGCLIGSPIAGAIYDATGSYDIPFSLAGTCLLGSAGLMMLASWITNRRKGKYITEFITNLATSQPKISFISSN